MNPIRNTSRAAATAMLALFCFALGITVGTAAQTVRPTFDKRLTEGKAPAAVAPAMLDGALQLAEFKIGRVYAEGGEWAKAEQAFDHALANKPNDDTGMLEYGALANLHGDRDKPRRNPLRPGCDSDP